MKKPYILMVSPDGPPKNSAEGLQVRRLLSVLDERAQGIWVHSPISSKESVKEKSALTLTLTNFEPHMIRPPLGSFGLRLLRSHRLRRLYAVDSEGWMQWYVATMLKQLPQTPDIIYSRSQPFSSALVASRLKRRLNVPWVMHLSDPWTEQLSGKALARQAPFESACMRFADGISFTTQGQKDWYAGRYPQQAEKMFVSPNMYPLDDELPEHRFMPAADAALKLMFIGSLYGGRNAAVFCDAIAYLQDHAPDCLKALEVHFYGRVQPDDMRQFARHQHVISYHGHVSATRAKQLQAEADLLLTIDPLGEEPVHHNILLTKLLDAMRLGTGVFSLAHEDSCSAQLCEQGFGWCAPLDDAKAVASRLQWLIENREAVRAAKAPPLPEQFYAQHVADSLLARMQALLAGA